MTPEYIGAIAELVNAIAWPLVIILFVVLFRERISDLLAQLEELKLGSASAKIRREVERVASTVPIGAKPEPPNKQQIEIAQRIEELSQSTDMGEVRRQMLNLAREYENTRAAMNSGHSRTRRMEGITNKMRTLGLACYPYLSEFTRKDNPGERLAAIAILQVKPDHSYLQWLADRAKIEKPFVGYHAAIALLVAARLLDVKWRDDILSAVKRAKSYVEDKKHSDRYQILNEAMFELSEDGVDDPAR